MFVPVAFPFACDGCREHVKRTDANEMLNTVVPRSKCPHHTRQKPTCGAFGNEDGYLLPLARVESVYYLGPYEEGN